MIAYIDTSVVLRIIFGEPHRLPVPSKVQGLFANEILKIECFRTLERMRLSLNFSEKEMVEYSVNLNQALRSINLIKFDQSIGERACQAFPITIKTLDAIHLSTALLWKGKKEKEMIFLTHDEQLGKTAAAVGFTVLGCKFP